MTELSLSFIVPVYNPDRSVLERCLSCFDNPLNGAYEVLIVSDGSDNNVVDEIKHYTENKPWVHVIEQENTGVSSARNNGIEHATGKWITFCDADDYIDVEKALSFITKLNDSDYGYASYRKIKEDREEEVTLDSVEKSDALIKKTLSVPNLYGTVWSKFFFKDTLYKFNIRFHEELTHAEDTIFILEYLKHVKHIRYFNEAFYTYYVYASSSAKQNPEAVKHYLDSMKYVIQIYQNTEYEKYAGNFCVINLLIMMVHHIWKKGISYQNGKAMMKDILSNDAVSYALNVYNPESLSKTSRIMAYMLKHKHYFLCYAASRYRNK